MAPSEKQLLEVFLPEELPWDNRGEAAILLGILRSLESIGPFHLTLPSDNRADIENYSHSCLTVTWSSLTSRRPAAVLAWLPLFLLILVLGSPKWLIRLAAPRSPALTGLLKADVVIVGHDNFFAYVGLRSLLRFLLMVGIAKRTGKLVVVYGASIGPLKAQLTPQGTLRRLVEDGLLKLVRPVFRIGVLAQADLITLREAESRSFLRRFGTGREAVVTADLAFLMEPAEPEEALMAMQAAGLDAGDRRQIIGLTADRWVARHVGRNVDAKASDERRTDRFISLLADLIDRASQDLGCRFLLVPQVTGPEPFQDDRALLRQIESAVESDSVHMLGDGHGAQVMKAVLGRCTLVLGTRTHSLIAAASMGVPVLALTYPGRNKTNGIIGAQLGLRDSLVDVEGLWDGPELFDAFSAAMATKERMGAMLDTTRHDIMRQALKNGTLLAELLTARRAT